jgi:hypothetical protein
MSVKKYYLDQSNNVTLFVDFTSFMDKRLEEFQTIANQFGFYCRHIESNIRWAIPKEVYVSNKDAKNDVSEIGEDFINLKTALKSSGWQEEKMDKN